MTHPLSPTSALVVLSGGQDSTTCLYWARQQFSQVEAVTFDYGQRHRIELDCAHHIATQAGVRHTELPINTFAALGGNALTDNTVEVPDAMPNTGLPTSFVPGRNLIFLTFAAALAYQRGIGNVVTGVAQVDYSGYPDCRENTMKALELALNLGMDTRLTLHAPLMTISKAESIHLAQHVGALEALAYTHTCYHGTQPPCGHCIACTLRAQGFQEAGIPDPLLVRLNAVPAC